MVVIKTRAAVHCTCELYNGCDDWWDLDNSWDRVGCNPSNNWIVFPAFSDSAKHLKSLLKTDGNPLSFLSPNLSPPPQGFVAWKLGSNRDPYQPPLPHTPLDNLPGQEGGGTFPQTVAAFFFVKCNRGHGRCLVCFQIMRKMEKWKRDDLETPVLKLEAKTSGQSLMLRISKYKKKYVKEKREKKTRISIKWV